MMKKTTAIVLTVIMLLTAVSAAFADDGILRPGDRGEEVRQLQEKLIELEYLEGEATGVYDEATEAAVVWFQRDHYLLVTGMADNTTRRLIGEETDHAQIRDERYDYDVVYEEAGAMYDAGMPAMTMMPASLPSWTTTVLPMAPLETR